MTLETDRLLFRRPTAADAPGIFNRYASDAEVTHYLSWPRHRSPADTEVFLAFCNAEWSRWDAGPLLVYTRGDGLLVGSTGLSLESHSLASTGYVFARDAWGLGYATEALGAMVEWARHLHLSRLYALCHTDHRASWRVMEKCGFTREGILGQHIVFPNLSPDPADVLCYGRAP